MLKRLYRLLAHVSGADPARLDKGPVGDKQFAMRIGLQLVFSSAFILMITAASLIIGFGRSPASVAGVVAVATLIAGVVALFDASIIASDNHEHGLELARQRGFEDGLNIHWEKFKRRVIIAIRLTMSVVIGISFAMFFELWLYSDDILRKIDSDYRAANALLFHDVETTYDRNLASLDSEIARQSETASLLDRQAADMRARLFQSDSDEKELQAALETLARLTAAKDSLKADAYRRASDTINEKWGVKERADHSGKWGEGDRYNNAKDHADLANAEAQRLASEIADVQANVAALRARKEREDARRQEFASAGLQKVNAEAAPVGARRDELTSQRSAAIANRETAVLATVQSRPGYVPKVDGFLIRVEALEVLKQRPAVASICLWATIIITMIDVAAVLSKVFFSMPTLHALGAALDFEDAASERVQSARRRLHRGPAKDVRDEMEVEELRRELAEKQAARRSKEAAMRELYGDRDQNRKDAA